MTDEERKELCEDLRYWKYPPYMAEACIKAADEIERLQGENDWLRTALRAAQIGQAQSDAEPAVKMDWSLSEAAKRQLEEIERATIRPGDVRLNNIVGPRHADAEPVAWRYASPEPPELWAVTCLAEIAEQRRNWGWPVEPLYTAPPRPDASAGLIEAAELLESEARIDPTINRRCELHRAASFLRARAADRSMK